MKKTKKTKLYNYLVDVAFTIEVPHDDFDSIPTEIFLKGLEKRLQFLKDNPQECYEAFGFADVYEV